MADETDNQTTQTNEDKEDRVRNRAYEIWEREGRKEGEHDRHWHQARQELEGQEMPMGSDLAPQGNLAQAGGTDPADGRSGTEAGGTVFDESSVVVEDGGAEAAKPTRRGRLLG